jgi:N-acetylmuramoyl-L-alanine amidase
LQPNNKRAVKEGGKVYLLENLNTTAILIECGFLTNKEECARLCEKEYQKNLSFAIVCGIIEYVETKNHTED